MKKEIVIVLVPPFPCCSALFDVDPNKGNVGNWISLIRVVK